VIIANDEQIAGEREIGVCELQQRPARLGPPSRHER
jgi:hypothetical protein